MKFKNQTLINKLINVPDILNDLNTKVDGFDADELKTMLVDLKRLSDLVENEAKDKNK